MRLGTMARPRGGDWLKGEMKHLALCGVDVLVSTLCDDEILELGLTEEASVARRHGIEFLTFPIDDRGVPEKRTEFEELMTRLLREPCERSIVVHCRQGIGPSSMVAAGLLIRQGILPDVAWAKVADARGRPVPDTEDQRDWIESIAFEAVG